ncbi:MAG: redoxin domain-containing protein [Desulfuromonadales bacterium]|nr:redoxin domain-containing protein [Desulfuromonadales bacterium]NIS39581.1 redoxin domain-containing protein [Desulfuromonadales bacterium]
MGLQDKLDGISREFASQADPAIVKEIKKGVEHLAKSGIMDRVVGAGEQAPDFTLEEAGGEQVSLESLRHKGPVVLSFYRGLW